MIISKASPEHRQVEATVDSTAGPHMFLMILVNFTSGSECNGACEIAPDDLKWENKKDPAQT